MIPRGSKITVFFKLFRSLNMEYASPWRICKTHAFPSKRKQMPKNANEAKKTTFREIGRSSLPSNCCTSKFGKLLASRKISSGAISCRTDASFFRIHFVKGFLIQVGSSYDKEHVWDTALIPSLLKGDV